MWHRQGRLWRGPFPTRRSTFQAPQNGRRDPAQAGYPVNPIEWVTKSASSVTNSVTTGITQATGPPPRRTWRPFWIGTAVLWRGSFPTSPAAFQAQYRGWRERAQGHHANWGARTRALAQETDGRQLRR